MVVKLTANDIVDLKAQGYTDQHINKAIAEIEKEDLQSKTTGGIKSDGTAGKTSAFSTKQMGDIASFQLELNDLLEQTEHILKGDIVITVEGKRIWQDNPTPENNPLSEEGVRKIMLQLQTYVNRHIILGDYEIRDINRILKGYGKAVSNFIFMKYEEMGMDTEQKRQEYTLIVENVVNLVYASYKRAEGGGERRSLREMINVQQTHQTAGQGVTVNAGMQQQKVRGILNPMRYVGGKYAT